MSRHLVITTLLVVASFRTAVAQVKVPESTGPPLTLAIAVSEALTQNPDLRALRSHYETARAAPAQERFLMPPTLETQIWSWPVNTLNPARTDMYMFTAEQELPGKGKRAARTAVAEREADVARQQVDVRANEILAEVKHAYVDLGLARELRLLYNGQLQLLQDLTEAAAIRYASGEGGQHHTVASLVELTRLEKDRIDTDQRIEAAEARLNTALGRPVARDVEPLAPVVSKVTVAEAESLALARHPDLAAADAAIAREEAELARVRGELRPDFIIGGGYMLMPGDAGAVTLRGGITWPNAPWSRGRQHAAIDTQLKRVEAAKAQREAVAARVRHVIRNVSVRIAASQRQAQLIQSTVLPQVEHAFELARVSYMGGEGTFVDVLESRRLLLTTQLEYAEARASISRALTDLETAVGIQ
jgi:cobalt-zinc-cadmium efflux system outer membrane protein